MADFHTTSGCNHQLERIIIGARERLFLVSPFLQLSDTLIQRLQDAARRSVQITVVYGKADMAAKQRANLASVGRFELYFLANLHAKCYASEAGMLITSMNLYEYSAINNREMGVFFLPDEPAYGPAWNEILSIIAAADPELLTDGKTPTVAEKPARVAGTVQGSERAQRRVNMFARGFCVRCHTTVPVDPDRPLCSDCFQVWNAYGDAEYPEQWCHVCGTAADTSMVRPMCRSCYRTAVRVSI